MFCLKFKFYPLLITISKPHSILFRIKSTKNDVPHPNTAKIKRLNSDFKLLFGPVQKQNKKIKHELPPPTSELSSEMHWLLEHKPDYDKLKRPVGKKKKTKPATVEDQSNAKIKKEKPPKPPKVTTYGLPKPKKESAVLPEALVKLTDRLESIPIPLKITKSPAKGADPENAQSIPFSAKELKLMLSYPLFDRPNAELCKLKPRPDLSELRIPSVSRILSATMPEASRKALESWKAMKIAELGLDGFQHMQQEHFNVGKNFHVCLQRYFETGTIDESIETELWKSVEGALDKFQTPANLVETHIIHPTLLYKGIADCITVVDNTVRIIEWKKSDRLKANIEHTYDAPIQLAAYLGALQNNEKHQKLDIRNGVVVVAYTTGVPAHVHFLNESDMNKYWRKWLARLQEYWVRLRDYTLPENV